jgi:DNA-binding CsgD family transcriptional regulator
VLLYDREAERSIIGELLDGARESRGGVLVIRGEAGVGKSALLDDARERASGMQVLSCAGIESESALPFAALHQLLRPVLHNLEQVPAPQASALQGALGVAAGRGDDRFLVFLAVLSLLAEAAERRPLLCLVDDAHWLDDATADALVFVARRIEAEAIVVLFAAREGGSRPFETSELRELRLGGLDAEAAGALLDSRAPVALSPETRAQLVQATGGHPLALIELPSTLSEAQLSGDELVLTPIRVSIRVEQAFLGRVRELPEPTQTLLLVAAADDTGEASTVLRAAAQLNVGPEALDAAEAAGLASMRGTMIELHHPLVRSAVYQGARLSQRQAAHRALATALDGEAEADRRAWHRAAASVEPDASVVDELEQAAERARRRSAFAAASLASERAASLTKDEQLRAPRLTAAAENAWLAGRPSRALTLLERGRAHALDTTQRADIDGWRGLIELNSGVPANAYQLLVRAAAEAAPVDGTRALKLLNTASFAASLSGDRTANVTIAELAKGLAVDETPLVQTMTLLLVGLGALSERDFTTAASSLGRALELGEELEDDVLVEEPSAWLFAGRASLYLGDDQSVYSLHQRLAARARASGALGTLVQALPRLANAEVWAGRWAAASANAREGLELASEIKQHNLVAHLLAVLALIAAHRGDEEDCRSLAAEGRELATARGLAISVESADWAIALLELGLGRPEEAFRAAREISGTLSGFWSGFDRIESAIHAGERDTAREWLDPFEQWAGSSGAAWARAAALHCRALLSEDEHEAERSFLAALDVHAVAKRPFQRARTELACGAFLRRARRRVEAREHLRAAFDGFETLRSTPWAERARIELRASGQTARRRIPSTQDQLTAQELQIAHFVAQGLSNRDVGAQLFLSPRTIAAHLRSVFRKLGISSRTELARVYLEAIDPTAGDSMGAGGPPTPA